MNARDCDYQLIELFGKPALFTESRVDRNSVPVGLYAYDTRHGDSLDPETIEPTIVVVNHAGTVIMAEPLEFTTPKETGDSYLDITDEIDFISESCTLDEFIAKTDAEQMYVPTEDDSSQNTGMGVIHVSEDDTGKEAIKKWLTGSNPICTIVTDRTSYNLIKLPKDTEFDYLFYQGGSEYLRGTPFNYVGVYDKRAMRFHDLQYQVQRTLGKLGGYDPCTSYGNTKAAFERAVRDEINAIIGDDRNKLSITDASQIKNYECIRKLEDMKYHCQERIRKLFLEGKTPEMVCFDSCYEFGSCPQDTFDGNDYLNTLRDMGKIAKRFAERWIKQNQEYMFVEFETNDAVKIGLQAIIDNPSHPLHYVRAIMTGMNSTKCKTVKVTTLIDGKALTFKTDANELRMDCQNHYSSFFMSVSDRHAFEEMYGKHATYGPRDIVRITYSKGVLYDRDTFEKTLGVSSDYSQDCCGEGQESSQIMGGLS